MREADEFLEFVASVLGTGREGLSLETAFGSVPEWDSVMHLRLVMEIQDRYSVDIPLEKVPEMRMLEDFYGVVCQRREARTPRVRYEDAAV